MRTHEIRNSIQQRHSSVLTMPKNGRITVADLRLLGGTPLPWIGVLHLKDKKRYCEERGRFMKASEEYMA